ncbi:hypothetical protein KBB89_04125, partial [Candidatus Gracilibacteria bacterium]|nr:hypothetical protein [Candidatus Gracilibacteria bacterium]
MSESFTEKQKSLLKDLKKIALMHNRDYFVSLIPFVESATADQEELLDTYQIALDEDRNRLMQSHDALVTP